MRKIFLIIAAFLFSGVAIAQVPHLFKYQGLARDSSGNPISNDTIALRISIHQGTPTGTVVYQETHNPITNLFGSFSINIGGGTVVTGNFSTIPWSRYNFFQEVEMDATGGTNFISMGTSQYLSVPYALATDSAAHSLLANHSLLADSALNGASSGFRAHMSNSVAVPPNGNATINYDVIEYNDGNNFANGVFTAPSNGFYHFDALTHWSAPAFNQIQNINNQPYPTPLTLSFSLLTIELETLLKVNGSMYDVATTRIVPNGNGIQAFLKLSTNVYLSAGQTVSVQASNYSIIYSCTVSGAFSATYISGYKIY